MKIITALEKITKKKKRNWKDVNTKFAMFLFWMNKTLRHVRSCQELRYTVIPCVLITLFFIHFSPSHLLMRYAVFCLRSLYLDINLFDDLMFQVSLVLSQCLAPLDVLYACTHILRKCVMIFTRLSFTLVG